MTGRDGRRAGLFARTQERRRGRISALVALLVLVLLAVGAGAAFAEELSVQVRETRVRREPRSLASEVGRLSYGDRVQVVDERPDWVLVEHGTIEGWVSRSAVTPKEIVLEASDREVEERATDREVALAGRGFNKDIEEQYRRDTGLSYAAIDELEEREEEPDELARFLEEGGLRLPGEDE